MGADTFTSKTFGTLAQTLVQGGTRVALEKAKKRINRGEGHVLNIVAKTLGDIRGAVSDSNVLTFLEESPRLHGIVGYPAKAIKGFAQGEMSKVADILHLKARILLDQPDPSQVELYREAMIGNLDLDKPLLSHLLVPLERPRALLQIVTCAVKQTGTTIIDSVSLNVFATALSHVIAEVSGGTIIVSKQEIADVILGSNDLRYQNISQ